MLDEAVANLDAENEARLAEALEAASAGRRQAGGEDHRKDGTGGRATLVVAHRLSTIRRADHVVVLEEGRVTEQGAFADLAADPGSRLSWLLAHQ
nr:hypothetical protein GCM10020093_079430 [Planobispora longispora]